MQTVTCPCVHNVKTTKFHTNHQWFLLEYPVALAHLVPEDGHIGATDLEDTVGEKMLVFNPVPESEIVCGYPVTYDG